MRPRTKDRHLPACVYQKHGAYWYVKKNKWTKLGVDLHEALIAYARIVAPADGFMPDLIDKAMPAIIDGKSPSTQQQYTYVASLLKEVFAEFMPDQVRHGDIVQMMDMYKDNYATGNRMLTVLKLVFQWALDRGIINFNPAISVKRHKQQTRDRLITTNEYQAIYKNCPDWMQVIMDVCFLTGQRIGDVLHIKRSDLREDGIYFQQQKTGKKLIVAWTPELSAAIERAKAARKQTISMTHLFTTRGGVVRAHSNVWKTFKKAAAEAGVENVTLHDLRAMSGTEADNQGIDSQKLLGHTDRRTTQIYLRDKTAKVVQGPRKKAQ